MAIGVSASPGVAYTAPAYSNRPAASASAPDSSDGDPVAEFNKLAGKSPAERMRALMLAKMGLKEEDLKAMDPKERQKIEDMLRERIRQAAMHAADKSRVGLVADVKV